MQYSLLTILDGHVVIGYSISQCDYEFTIKDDEGFIIHNHIYSTYDEYMFRLILCKNSNAKEFISI